MGGLRGEGVDLQIESEEGGGRFHGTGSGARHALVEGREENGVFGRGSFPRPHAEQR